MLTHPGVPARSVGWGLPLYTAAFRRLLSDQGVVLVRIPPRSPNLNAYAERFARTVRAEYLDQNIILLSEAHLWHALREFLEHYHQERNHQGLDNALIQPRAGPVSDNGQVLRKQRLGDVLNFYCRGTGAWSPTSTTATGHAGLAELPASVHVRGE